MTFQEIDTVPGEELSIQNEVNWDIWNANSNENRPGWAPQVKPVPEPTPLKIINAKTMEDQIAAALESMVPAREIQQNFKPIPKAIAPEEFLNALSEAYRQQVRENRLDEDKDADQLEALARQRLSAERLVEALSSNNLDLFEQRLNSIRKRLGESATKAIIDTINQVAERLNMNLVVDYAEDGTIYLSNKSGNGEAIAIKPHGKADRVRLVTENGETRYEPTVFRGENRQMHANEFAEIANLAFNVTLNDDWGRGSDARGGGTGGNGAGGGGGGTGELPPPGQIRGRTDIGSITTPTISADSALFKLSTTSEIQNVLRSKRYQPNSIHRSGSFKSVP